jgi:hypothetical protein
VVVFFTCVFKNENVYLVSAEPKALKRTFAFLVESQEDSIGGEKLKRPSVRGPI